MEFLGLYIFVNKYKLSLWRIFSTIVKIRPILSVSGKTILTKSEYGS